jgi:hypothetical protein
LKVRKCLSYSDIANEISMLRSAFDGTVLVVEGITDLRLYGKFIDVDRTRLIVGHSKENVRYSVKESMEKRKDRRTLGIVDSDLDRMNGVVRQPPIFVTDCRDCEMMIMKSGALQEVLWEYADREALERFEGAYGSVTDALLNASYPVGLLMFISCNEKLGLSFKDLDPEIFVNERDLRTDPERLVDEILFRSNSPGLNRRELLRLLKREMGREWDPWDVCRGHDTVEILVLGLRSIFGAFNSRGLRGCELSGSLRLAYGKDDFAETRLHRSTREWCEANGMGLWLF